MARYRPQSRPIVLSQRGMTLIDVLVATILFAIGILGMVAMQATMMHTTLSSEDRATAALLADELIADCQIGYAVALTCSMPTAGQTKITHRLPGTSATTNVPVLAQSAAGVWTITISWQEPSRTTSAGTAIIDSYFTEFTLP